MYPPTPTQVPIEMGTTHETLQLAFAGEASLWETAPEVVGLWGSFSDYTPVLQWMVVAILCVVLLWMAARVIKSLSEDEL
jgi:hypothetical protein